MRELHHAAPGWYLLLIYIALLGIAIGIWLGKEVL